LRRNTLIQYTGGGYDGCHWEWNLAYFDKCGKFHNVHATGRKGAETLKRLEERLADDTFYEYDLSTEEGRAEFVTEVNSSLVLGVAQWLRQHVGIELVAECGECGREFSAAEMVGGDYRGQGGIVSAAYELLCRECAVRREMVEGEDLAEFFRSVTDRGGRVEIVELPAPDSSVKP